MPREIITTSYTDIEFRELLKSIVHEAVKEEIDRVLNRESALPPHKDLLTRKEVAIALGLSVVTIIARTNDGTLPSRRIGKKVFYKWADVQKALMTFEEKRAARYKSR